MEEPFFSILTNFFCFILISNPLSLFRQGVVCDDDVALELEGPARTDPVDDIGIAMVEPPYDELDTEGKTLFTDLRDKLLSVSYLIFILGGNLNQ